MPGKGLPPTPTSILKMRGSWRAKTRPDQESPQLLDTTPPTYLSAKQREHWDDIVPALTGVQIATEADRQALARYCALTADWFEVRRCMEQGAMTASCGSVEAERMFKKSITLSDMLLKYEMQFGMTPSSRTRVKTEKPDKKSDKPKLESFKLG